MSKRDYRKKLKEKEVHKEELKQRSLRSQTFVSPLDVEFEKEKNKKNFLFSDLRGICLERYYHKYLSYIQVPKWDFYGKRIQGEFDQQLDPLVEFGNELFSSGPRKNSWFGYLEKKSMAHLLQVVKRSNILDGKKAKTYLCGLFNLIRWKQYWVRDAEKWVPPDASDENQFNSLVAHLLVKYQMPAFFYKVWIDVDIPKSEDIFQRWFVNIGAGENLRTQKGLPITVTKKIAHYFMTAPYFCHPIQAIRWGQVMALGGDERTARGVIDTSLGRGFQANEDFWQTLIKFFIENTLLDTNHYQVIYDYVFDQKYRDRGNIVDNGEIRYLGCAQPNFSMKGREPNNLMTLAHNWHVELGRQRQQIGGRPKQDNLTWISCGIPGLTYKDKDGSGDIYLIRELTSSDELWLEGHEMRHCVYSYVHSCKEGHCAIYSLSYNNEAGSEKMLTVEVQLSGKKILQARGPCNARPTPKDISLLNIWAKSCGVILPENMK